MRTLGKTAAGTGVRPGAPLVAAVAAAIVAQAAHAQGGPPFMTDDTGTPGRNRWEINVAATLERRPGEYLLQTPDLDINFGLGERIQLKYETSWDVAGVSEGRIDSALGNSHFGVKWRFLDSRGVPVSVSVYPQADFNPVSSAEYGLLDRGTEAFLPVETVTSLGPIELVVEAGYNVVFDGPDGVAYGAIAACSIGRVTVGAEVHGEADVDLDEDEIAINVGAMVPVVGDHNLLVSVGRSPRGSGSGEPDLLGYLGVQIHVQQRRYVRRKRSSRRARPWRLLTCGGARAAGARSCPRAARA